MTPAMRLAADRPLGVAPATARGLTGHTSIAGLERSALYTPRASKGSER